MQYLPCQIAIIGTGIVGIATAYYLAKNHGLTDIVLIDRNQPMTFTSAQSGENYRRSVHYTTDTNNIVESLSSLLRSSMEFAQLMPRSKLGSYGTFSITCAAISTPQRSTCNIDPTLA
ncbi:FAD-dependent oxidoreductase [Alphaproteobacteria bacterium]|nr:FAD-dependent oxidoreductase [Alphaproteobacteria bacterium]